MSTKLNAEELANKRWAYRVDTGFGKAIQDGCKQGYAAAIREHSQPIADELDAVTRERDELRAAVEELISLIKLRQDLDNSPKSTEYPKP